MKKFFGAGNELNVILGVTFVGLSLIGGEALLENHDNNKTKRQSTEFDYLKTLEAEKTKRYSRDIDFNIWQERGNVFRFETEQEAGTKRYRLDKKSERQLNRHAFWNKQIDRGENFLGRFF